MSIVVDDLTVFYKKRVPVLDHISLEIGSGESIALLGENGSGKTSLAYCLNGIIPHSSPAYVTGTVTIRGKDTRKMSIGEIACNVGMVFQDPDLVIFNPTVAEEVAFGVQNLKLDQPQKRISAALRKVGLKRFEDADPQTLSEGRKQLLCIACVLAMGTQFIILDEPVAHLDYKNALMVYEVLSHLQSQGKTILVIEHDTQFVWDYCDRTVILHKGKIIADGMTKKILSQTDIVQNATLRPVLHQR